MEFEAIRKIALAAMFSDDCLLESLVLKGGNALSLVHGISGRSSIDLDFSLDRDFEDVQIASQRIQRSLEDRFDSNGYVVFDFKLIPRPTHAKSPSESKWGGYDIRFKVIEKKKFKMLDSLESIRRNSLVVAPGQKRIFKIQVSKYEYCKSKVLKELDGYHVFVYTPAAIVIEKIRALCQQLPEYQFINPKMKRPRPRDYYDIYTVVNHCDFSLDSPENLQIFRGIFKAKEVDLKLMGLLDQNRDFHEQEFRLLQDTVPEEVKPFSIYADFLRDLIESLKPFWNK